MYMAKQYSLFDDPRFREDGKALRDQGLEKVAKHNPDWLEECLRVFSFQYPTDPFTGEEIRFVMEQNGLYPTSPNAWGCLTRQLLKLKLIERTGQYRPMKDPRSHARMTAVYRKV